jgi:hypothetical protein
MRIREIDIVLRRAKDRHGAPKVPDREGLSPFAELLATHGNSPW